MKTLLHFTTLEDRLTPAAAVPDADFFPGEVHSEMINAGPGIYRIRSTGSGGGRLQVIEADTNEVVVDVQPYGKNFVGGIAIARVDLGGRVLSPGVTVDRLANDGFVIAPESRGSARIQIYEFANGALKTRADFIGVGGTEFRGGASIAVRHLNGSGLPDLVVGAGVGGGPRVAVYEFQDVIDKPNPKPFADFFIFSDLSQRGGVSFDVLEYNRGEFFRSPSNYQRDAVLITAARSGVPRVSLWKGRELGQAAGRIDEFVLDGSTLGGVQVDVCFLPTQPLPKSIKR